MSTELDELTKSLNERADAECRTRLISLRNRIQSELEYLTGITVSYEHVGDMSKEEAHFQSRHPLVAFIKEQGVSGCSGGKAELFSWQLIMNLHRKKYIRDFVKNMPDLISDESETQEGSA